MSSLDYHIKLHKIINESLEKQFLSESLELTYSERILEMCGSIEISTEVIGNKEKIRLLKKTIQTSVFDSLAQFRNSALSQVHSNVYIFNDNNPYTFIGKTSYINFEISNTHFFNNINTYIEFISFLKEQEKELDGTFHFIDSFNKDFRKIVLVSLSEKGRVTINYNSEIPEFDQTKDFSIGFRRFKDCFEDSNKTLIRFLKTSTINTISSFNSENRLKLFVENIETIVDKARVNFEVYLNEISVDKIKKDYDEVKSKYFNSLSDILSKLSQNIIALPFAIATLLFAIEKVKNETFYLYILIATILITSAYITTLLRVHFRDLSYIHKIFNFDYKILIENNFFNKHPEETELFKEIKNRIDDRVKFLRIIIETYFWTLNISNLILIGILLHYLKVSQNAIIFIGLIFLILVAILRNYVLEKDDKEK